MQPKWKNYAPDEVVAAMDALVTRMQEAEDADWFALLERWHAAHPEEFAAFDAWDVANMAMEDAAMAKEASQLLSRREALQSLAATALERLLDADRIERASRTSYLML